MSVEVVTSYTCSAKCTYCYQENIREAGNEGGDVPYNLDAIKAALLKQGARPTLFGGEATLMPFADMEDLCQFAFERFGGSSIQTHGAHISPRHIELFTRCRVSVGFSIDGPEALNDERRFGTTIEHTRAATRKSITALETCLSKGISASLIVTLHQGNASSERLPILLDWFRSLARQGLKSINCHTLEVDNEDVRRRLVLLDDQAVDAYVAMAHLMAEMPSLHIAPLTDMRRLLLGEDHWEGGGTSCIWNACDPYTTAAVQGITGDGNLHNCGRTAKEGIPFAKASQVGYERYLMLAGTPQAYGGCHGCRFWYACKGSCPGESEKGDWRGKTEHCPMLKRLFGALEAALQKEGLTPISLSPERTTIEQGQIDAWNHGQNLSITEIRRRIRTGEPILLSQSANRPHIDTPHVDRPHLDHGDTEHPIVTGKGATWAAV